MSDISEDSVAGTSIRLLADKEALEKEIAERKRIEAELKRSLSLLNATLEATADGILVVNQQGKIALFNSKFIEMWEIPHPVFTLGDPEKAMAALLKPIKDVESFSARLNALNQSDSENQGTLELIDGRILAWYAKPQQIGGERIGRVWCFHDITERKQAEERLNHLTNFDLLTNLPNRLLFRDRLGLAISRAPWHKRSVGVLLLDLDRFKVVNETLGQAMGDFLLKAVSERLSATVREGDTVARLGDDMFGLILDDLAQPADSFRVSQKILDSLGKPFQLKGQEIFVSASIGIAIFPNDGDEIDLLMKHADTAMYRAKEQGGNNYQLYAPAMNQHATKRLALENNLRRALERGEFLLYYQPKVDLTTGQIVGMEALIRWKSPEAGMVSPADFIPLAEETGLIVPMGEWILRTACAQNKAWQKQGLPPVRMGVNLSARQLQRQNLIGTIAHVLNETGLDPNYLELELTESLIMKSNESTMTELRELHLGGIEISIDDFGTGYSSLSYLKRLPIDTLKIDKSFVQEVTTDLDDAAIVAAIITMAHTLKLKVVAEAVETVEQLEFLRGLKCDQMQGYLFSKPLPAEEITRLLAEGKHL
ncbi:putative bifunctional diguanylate cyclase/phosphodiesterase [Candidatus Manganitrophus noduliformans]|uniref:EAL domain-containing protein n=1 Tax=Candidatus Manganitrophus noduliformans TaxID=2606439 RepID=A0A7X6DPV7_9BACT|nr:EAL domain-containing protein [Candidatus Manganitrophus noduliformans]NKE71160.1 EAL domain-containing protein [Candidatus Manganitrophus noduliformans]